MNRLSFINILFILLIAKPSSSAIIQSRNILRIVGGENASIYDYPYQVSVQFSDVHGCGGSIVNQKFILTAAHCTDGEIASSLSIRVNSSYRNEGGQVFQVKNINVHPDYNPKTFDYDISILELDTSLTFGDGVKPVRIASAGTQIVDGIGAVATGWGRLGEHKAASYQLQVVTLPLITTDSCAEYYPKGFVTNRMFCAGYIEGQKDTCEGDSGGPLVVSGIQIGLTSWGTVCAAPKQPGAFTKLSLFGEYIDSIINGA